MANRAAPALTLREGDREELVRLTRSSSVRVGLAQRSRIVLLAAEGLSNTAIAERVGASRPTGDRVAGPVPGPGVGRAERRAEVGSAPKHRPRRHRDRDTESTSEEVRRDALVDP